jgi:hypothetical protein
MVHDVVFYRLVHLIPEKLRKSLWRGQQRHGMVVWPGTGASKAPVVVESAYLWYEGPTEALTGRLMEPYEVIEVSKKKEAYEPNRRTATV